MKTFLLVFFLFVLAVAYAQAAQLRIGFYQSTCPRAESIVQTAVENYFGRDESITAALLRMHFHDCFVTGCDASILIDSTSTNQSEKEAVPNLTVRGFDLIDDIKGTLEAACPSTVSCADIIALATRDALALAEGPVYDVPTGRRDGVVSDAQEVSLPGPSISVLQLTRFFEQHGFTVDETVTLLGAHTVGVAHCGFFQRRLSSPGGTSNPRMDPALKQKLVKLCNSGPKDGSFGATADLDQKTPLTFDNRYYSQIRAGRGILNIDQQLALDSSTSGIVASFASNNGRFKNSFAKAIIKMGSLGVLVGNEGEVRKNCRVTNSPH